MVTFVLMYTVQYEDFLEALSLPVTVTQLRVLLFFPGITRTFACVLPLYSNKCSFEPFMCLDLTVLESFFLLTIVVPDGGN